jgi:hypothetical protein
VKQLTLDGKWARRVVTATGCALLGASLAGCNDFSLGTYANLSFLEYTPDAPGGQAGSPVAPIADGASIHITVNDKAGNDVVLQSVTSSAPMVLKVTGFSDDVFTLRAAAPGASTISVKTASTHDAIDLTVEQAVSTVLDAFTPNEVVGEDQSHFFPDFAMSSASDVNFAITHLDAEQNALTGFGATPFSATPASVLSAPADSDEFELIAPPNGGSNVTLHIGSSSHDIEIVDAPQAASIDLLKVVDGSFNWNQPLPPPVLEPQSFTTEQPGAAFDIVAHLTDGRFVFAPCGDFKFSVAAGGADMVQLAIPTAPYSTWQDPVRQIGISFPKPGATSFTIQCLGQTRTYHVTITQ